jgi:phage shock protein A
MQMSLKLFDRIATLVRADAHGMVESLEDRSLLLKQYVREAEIDLYRKRAELEALRDEEKRLREAQARREEEARALDEDVTLALAGGKDDLARFAIRRLLPRRSEAKAAAARLHELGERSRTIAERLAEQEGQFESLRARVRAELARESELGPSCGWQGEPIVADEEVELELMRRRRPAEGGGS